MPASWRQLSVSSNGSNWVKRALAPHEARWGVPFSILERIELGETGRSRLQQPPSPQLSVSSNGSNWVKPHAASVQLQASCAFSILERIELGETHRAKRGHGRGLDFQYPRTDRIG